MHQGFPTDREEKRQVLLAAVERIREVVTAGGRWWGSKGPAAVMWP